MLNDETLRQLTRDRRQELEREASRERLATRVATVGLRVRGERAPTAMLGLFLAARRLGTS